MPFRPNDITKEHVLSAVAKINADNIQLIPSTRYDVIIDGKPYPPKEVMRYAHEQLDGDKRWEYNGGEPTFKYLHKFGFEVINKNLATEMEDPSTDPHYWSFAPGENASEWDFFFEEGIMALGWAKLGDLRQYDSRDEIANKLRDFDGDRSSKSNDSLANFDFLDTMKIGDVIVPKRGRSTYLGYGIVCSDYQFDDSRERFKSYRRVDWKKKGEWQAGFKIALKTLTDITKYKEYVKELKEQLGIQLSAEPSFWFVCQGRTFNANEGKRYLFARHQGSDGRRTPHWESMKRVRKGDIIFNYSDKALRGVSIAKEDPRAGVNPNPTDVGYNNGNIIPITFFPLDPPISYDESSEFAKRLQHATSEIQSPFDLHGRIKQGYLFEFNELGARIVRNHYGKAFPFELESLLSEETNVAQTQFE